MGIDVEAEAAGDLGDLGRGGAGVEEPQRPNRLVAQGDGLGHGEDGHEHEVLVDHADACGHSVARTGEGDGLVVDEDLSGDGLVEAVEDVHERGLARAVLAQEGVDLAGFDG